MNSIQKTITIIQNKYSIHIRTQQRKLWRFALSAFLFTPRYESLNYNARLTGEKRGTARSKLQRYLSNTHLPRQYEKIVGDLKLVHHESIIIIDFSTFCGFQVLTFALQTQMGRAVPLYFDIIVYPIREETSQNIFIEDTVRRFIDIVGVKPRFVLDRGFALPTLINFFVTEQIPFYVRIKKGKHVTAPDKKGEEHSIAAQWAKRKDILIRAYGTQLRLLISPKPTTYKESWYIVTNDFAMRRKDILQLYYYRFEIEETFRDIKHVFNLNRFFIKKVNHFKMLLWIMILKVIIAYFLAEHLLKLKQHAKKKLSFVRLYTESLERCIRLSALSVFDMNSP